MVDNKKLIYILIAVVLVVVILFFVFNKTSNKTLEEITKSVPYITPIELAENKEKYQGKTVIISDAYIPSEAFIYIVKDVGEERIFIKPPNRIYCRNFNLEGKLEIVGKFGSY